MRTNTINKVKFSSKDKEFDKWLDDHTATVRANINGIIVIIDAASNTKDTYLNTDLVYLGTGTYYSIKGTKQNDKELTHFWKKHDILDDIYAKIYPIEFVSTYRDIISIFTDQFIPHFNIDNTIYYIYIMENTGNAFANIYWYKDDTTNVYLSCLSVDKDERNKGVGSKLQKLREDIGRIVGAKYSNLLVEKESWMYNWYIRRGYKDTDIKEDTRVWMKKKL